MIDPAAAPAAKSTLKWWLLGGGVGSVAACCLLTMVVGAFVGDDPKPATTTTGAPLGGYRIFGISEVTAGGYDGAFTGQWLLMDGATIDSIDQLSGDSVRITSRRSGELWHLRFDASGRYLLREIISSMGLTTNNTEKGTWTRDGHQLTLKPESCVSLGDACEGEEHTHELQTLRMTELRADDQAPAVWVGLRIVGPFPRYIADRRYLDLQRVSD